MPMLSAVFRRAHALPALMALSLLAACSSAPVAPAALYDFGLAPAASAGARLPTALRVADVAGPGWMDGNAIYYRLAYAQSQRTDVYANSRWVESPVNLFDARLRNAARARPSGGLSHARCAELARRAGRLLTGVRQARSQPRRGAVAGDGVARARRDRSACGAGRCPGAQP
ncbi:hypothetical protein FUT88_04475 [Ralstonia sp. TCR112]|nr:hypothetical protein FUT88_04475 [Ralstonia sp. TCR112]